MVWLCIDGYWGVGFAWIVRITFPISSDCALIDRVFQGMAQAPNAFADAKMFYSYEFTNVLTFGIMVLSAGYSVLVGSTFYKYGS